MKTVNVKVGGVVWDTGDINQTELRLPSNPIITMSEEDYNDAQEDPGIIADKLSDKYGYCVESYESEILV